MLNEERNRILAELAKYTGKQVPAAFLSRTEDFVPGVERFHYLISGIYRPSGSDYALSIVTKLSSPYEKKDEVVFTSDGRWLMTYAPRSGGLTHPDNRALVKCMDDRAPLGVFQQFTAHTGSKHGSTYRVLGLGLITNYDAKNDVFVVESVDSNALEQVTKTISDEKARYEVQLYAQLTNQFNLFAQTEIVSRTVEAPKRDAAFREVVLGEYKFTCAVCELKFRLDNLVEATAAHIVPKRKSGTDDPRNGLALCRTHHWAFDAGVFSLNDSCQVLPSEAIRRADTKNFRLEDLRGKSILLPQNESARPHPEALEWHRTNVWLK
jgi:hypothetical protein